MKKIIIVVLMFVGMVSGAWAQIDDVTLVVSGEGTTKDGATTKALRSAIEQAFGVFVSANTEILNDELVKDEIATVASGNVKKYTELGVITKPNGLTEVSLQATVSVKKLTSYAQSHGSSAEFAGATLAANVRLKDLNRENTQKALENLCKQINAIGEQGLYDCKINVGNATANGDIDIELKYYTTEKSNQIAELILTTLNALALSKNDIEEYSRMGLPLYKYTILESLFLYSHYRNAIGYAYYFPCPLPRINIAGYLYDIYDNLGNKYELKNAERYGARMVTNYGAGPNGPSLLYDWGEINYADRHECASGRTQNTSSGYIYLGYNILITRKEIVIPKCYVGGVSWKSIKEGGKKQKKKIYQSQLVCRIKGTVSIPAAILSQISGLEAKERTD